MVAVCAEDTAAAISRVGGFVFDGDQQYRDVFCGGNCDETARATAEKLGWLEELDKVIAVESARFRSEPAATAATTATTVVPVPGPDATAAPPALAGAAAPALRVTSGGVGVGEDYTNEEVADAKDVGAEFISVGHASGLWQGVLSTDGCDDADDFEILLSLMCSRVAQGPVSAFGCRATTNDGDGVGPTYTALHGTFDVNSSKVQLSSCDGQVVFTGYLELCAASNPTLSGGNWRDDASGASGTFTCTLASSSAENAAGLWLGEAAPDVALAHEVPLNPIKWCLVHRSNPAPGQPAMYGVGFFDDAGDVPGNPVLFYTLQGSCESGDEFLKVYEPPVPAILTVAYTDVKRAADGPADGGIALVGAWSNSLEGTTGTFVASLANSATL
jgi:hypothetical protein